jgi:lipopolysaccharide transport system permease protein
MHQQEEIRIKPPRSVSFDLPAIWQCRELLYFFVWRDVKVKYKQTYLGILWAILQPALLMVIFYFIFFRVLNVSTGMNYPVFAFSGLVLWNLFSSGITHSSESLLSNAPIIRKIYFPRLLIPLSSLLGALVDFAFAFVVLIVLIFFLKQPVSPSAFLFFSLAIIITFLSSFGIGSFLAALKIKFRDFRYLLPFVIQFLFFGSQVVYTTQSIQTNGLKNLLFLNPLNGALELFRAPFYNNEIYWAGVLISLAAMFFFLATGLFYFKKTEAYFADLV